MAQTNNEVLTNLKAALIISGLFYQQQGFGIAFDPAHIDYRHPQPAPAWHAVQKAKEDVRDCSGEYIKIQRVTSRISRFTITFDATAKLLFGWLAMGFGVATAPSGAPANERQTIKTTATGGGVKFNLDFEGLSEPTSLIPFDAPAAVVQAKLEATRSIKPGSVVVTGTTLNSGPGLVVEFVGRLAKANLPLLTKDDTGATGGTSTVTATTDGANKFHEAARMTGEKPPKFSVIESFIGSTGGAKLYKNLVVSSVAIRAVRKGKLSIVVTAYGSALPEVLADYEIPECSESDPIMVADCRFEMRGVFAADDLIECGYTFDNNIDLSDQAYRFDDIDIDELEIGFRSSTFTAQVLGTDTSDWFIFAQDSDNAFDDCALHCGVPGERCSIIAPYVQFALDEQELTFVGTKNKSAFNLTGRPSPDPSTGIVDRVEYHGATTTQFLQVEP